MKFRAVELKVDFVSVEQTIKEGDIVACV